ncbi:hypothetical protein [Kaistella palustris]|uniref:hypothetical protein n=1 Tax=Kaistella palustris TaxID=493376 RepID=UPI0003F72676|nr:hypothetical protein [Kaistella palustris]
MKTDHTQDKYTEILTEMKDEKMNWDFDEFLAAAEDPQEVAPIQPLRSSATFPKIFWMAAGLAFLVSLGVLYKITTKPTIAEQDQFVKNEILKQKENFGHDGNVAVLTAKDSVNVVSDSLVADSTSVQNAADVVEQILPKRGRIRRTGRVQYVQNAVPERSAPQHSVKTPDYHSNYVIINGQKIENEQEAIDLTKYSFRVLSENVSKTVAQTDVITNFNNDY